MRDRYLFKWLQGYNAFEDEIPFERNPYAHEWDADAWAEGWLNAWANGWLPCMTARSGWSGETPRMAMRHRPEMQCRPK